MLGNWFMKHERFCAGRHATRGGSFWLYEARSDDQRWHEFRRESDHDWISVVGDRNDGRGDREIHFHSAWTGTPLTAQMIVVLLSRQFQAVDNSRHRQHSIGC